MPSEQVRKWWKEATCYQIWPASFQDSNDDGCGDIPGIISRLDYLKELGIDLIWLSPVYDSPQHDMGYDIASYEDIWPKYGTLKDMEQLIMEVKMRDMKIIMDLVVNHTSNEHIWFKESAKTKDEDNHYRNWYHWRDPKGFDADGKPIAPNNWRAAFGGSVWTYVEARKQFYLHLGLPEQPDLNWFNSRTRSAIFDSAIEFWLKRGIDGFRVDVVNFYWKDLTFPDSVVTNPGELYQPMEAQYIVNGPLMHDWLQEQRREALDKYGDVVLVGELPATSGEEILQYLSPENRELDMILDFDIFMAGNSWNALPHEMRKPKLTELKSAFCKTQGLINGGWPTAFLESHDNSRSIDRFGPGADSVHRVAAARMLALLVTTLSGTLYIYQGQEIGMTNMPKTWAKEDLRDKAIINYLADIERKYPGDAEWKQRAHDAALRLGRDNARTPVQWSSDAHAGFTRGEPWIAVNDNYRTMNAKDQEGKDDSVLEFWRSMLRKRKQLVDTLVYGRFELLDEQNEEKLSFVKSSDAGDRIYVELNWSNDEQALLTLPATQNSSRKFLMSSHPDATTDEVSRALRPWEGRAYII